MILAIGLYIIPLFFVVTMAPVLLKEQRIKLLVFVLSLVLPLFALPVLLILFIKECCTRSDNSHPKPKRDRFSAATFVVNLVAEPYKMKELNGICWEGIIIFRRLILVIIATLITSTIIRQVLLVFACLIAMMIQVRIQPFKRTMSNVLETLSLAILLCIANMNLVKAVFVELGEIPRGSADTLLRFYDIVEQCIVTFAPLLLLALIVISVLIRLLLTPLGLINKTGDPYEDPGIGDGKNTNIPAPDDTNPQSLQNARYQSLEGYPPATGTQLPYQ